MCFTEHVFRHPIPLFCGDTLQLYSSFPSFPLSMGVKRIRELFRKVGGFRISPRNRPSPPRLDTVSWKYLGPITRPIT